MAVALSEVTKTELAEKYSRAASALKRVREETKKGTARFVDSTLTVAGGAAVGAIRGFSDEPPTLPGTEIPLDAALGMVLTAAGIVGAGGDEAARAMTSLGGGMLAVSTAKYVEEVVRSRGK